MNNTAALEATVELSSATAAARPVVRPCTVSEVMCAPEWEEILAEYVAEASIKGMPPPNAKIETYRKIESTGNLHSFMALEGNRLVGFIYVLAPVLPHYGIPVAVCESFFVASKSRKGGAGLRLLRAAEDKANELGSPGLVVSAPFGGRLCDLLPRCGYVETNRVFFKKSVYL